MDFEYNYIKKHFGGNLALGTQQMLQNKLRANPKSLLDYIVYCLDLSGTESIIDVACGNGFILSDVVKKLRNGGRVVALDISESMLNLAKENVNISWVPIEFVRDDATKIEVSRYGKFDRVMVNFLFHYIAEPDSFIPILKKLLNPGGRLNIAIEARNSMAKMYSMHFEGMKKAGFPEEFIKNLPRGRRGKMVLDNAREYLEKSFNYVIEVPYKNQLLFSTSDEYMQFYIDGHGYCGVRANAGEWFTESMKSVLEEYVRNVVETEINKSGVFCLDTQNSIFICTEEELKNFKIDWT